MEQYRTRPPQHGPRRGAPLPPQGRRSAAAPGGSGAAVRPGGPGRPEVRDGAVGARPTGQGNGAAQRRPAARARSSSPLDPAARRLPGPRLTGLGGGLFCTAVMLVLGCLDQLVCGASLTVYGALFLPVATLTALWVRRGDLVTAPVVVPIAFAVGLLAVAEGNGAAGRLVGVVTALATQAGWLYGGTLVAGVITTVRKVRVLRRKAAARRRNG